MGEESLQNRFGWSHIKCILLGSNHLSHVVLGFFIGNKGDPGGWGTSCLILGGLAMLLSTSISDTYRLRLLTGLGVERVVGLMVQHTGCGCPNPFSSLCFLFSGAGELPFFTNSLIGLKTLFKLVPKDIYIDL